MYEVKIVKDLCYAPERLERNALDLYLPQGEGPFPLLVFFYGGGLEQGVKEDLEGMGPRVWPRRGVAVGGAGLPPLPRGRLPGFPAGCGSLRCLGQRARRRLPAPRQAVRGRLFGGLLPFHDACLR